MQAIVRLAYAPVLTIVLALALLLTTATAQAENGLALFGGWRGGGGFTDTATGRSLKFDTDTAGSLAINLTYDADRQWEIFASRQKTVITGSTLGTNTFRLPLTVTYLHVGGLNYFEGPVGTGPYVLGGLGVTVMRPDLDGFSSETRPSMNLGAGYRFAFSKALSLRAEARAYLTLINSSGSFMCSGGCTVSIKGDSLTQYEAMLGLHLAF